MYTPVNSFTLILAFIIDIILYPAFIQILCTVFTSSDFTFKCYFILNCPDLASTRKYYIDELKSMLYEIDHDVSVTNIVNNDELFIQLILDVTSPCIPMVFQWSTALIIVHNVRYRYIMVNFIKHGFKFIYIVFPCARKI
jgi:hypothetical protein